MGARRAARPGGGGTARGRRARPGRSQAGQDEAVDDDPPARHRRGPGQLGCTHRHDHPRCDPARHGPCRSLRDPTEPRAGAARHRREAVQGAAQRSLRSLGRRRARDDRAQAGRLEPARDPRRLLRDGQPARLRRPRRRAGRRRDHGEGTAGRRGDASGLGGAEAVDRCRARPHVPLLRSRSARLRPVAQGLERLHADGASALLPERDGRPARPGERASPLRFVGKNDRDERAHRHSL